jgi:hypothetical protein
LKFRFSLVAVTQPFQVNKIMLPDSTRTFDVVCAKKHSKINFVPSLSKKLILF